MSANNGPQVESPLDSVATTIGAFGPGFDTPPPTFEEPTPAPTSRRAAGHSPMDFAIVATGVAGFAVSFFNFYGVTSTNGQIRLAESAWHGWYGWIAAVLLLVTAAATSARIAGGTS